LKFTDPIDTFIETNVFFQYNPDYTNLSINTLQENVKTTMTAYFASRIGKFGQAFRASQLQTSIDDVSPAILSSRIETKMQQRINPSSGVEQDFYFSYPAPIQVPDDLNLVVQSSIFKRTFGGQILNCRIQNELKTDTRNGRRLQVVDTASGDVKVDNVGSYDAGAGIVNLVGFKSDTGDQIKLSVSPANPSAIVPSREYILKHDTTRLSAKGIRTTASN
jgi:hypothetical protein